MARLIFPVSDFLSRSAWSLDQHRTVAFGNLWKDVEELMHGAAAADDVDKAVFRLQFLAQFLDQTKVSEGFHTANSVPIAVAENARGDTNGNATVFSVIDGVLLEPLPYTASERIGT